MCYTRPVNIDAVRVLRYTYTRHHLNIAVSLNLCAHTTLDI